jgi:phage gpG-like protein
MITSNAAEVAGKLNALAARIGNPVPMLERARILFAAQERDVWTTQGANLGAPWAPLADTTAKLTSPQLLVASGALRNSLAGYPEGDIIGQTTLRMGTDVTYARFHQFGTRYMPAREIVGVSDNLRRQVAAAYVAVIEAEE